LNVLQNKAQNASAEKEHKEESLEEAGWADFATVKP
jgi:hypothetical protein